MDDQTQTPLIERAFSASGEVPEGVTAEPVTETPTETPTPEKAEAPEVKADAPATEPAKEAAKAEPDKKEPAEAKEDTEPKPVWDSDDNPYKQRASELAKREKAARDWATQINQQYVNQQRELAVINKKLDGTYDPAVDDPRGPDPQQILSEAQIAGKVQASEMMARERYGDKFEPEIQRFHELFDTNQLIQQRVLTSKAPMVEAFKVLREWDITQKYGSTDVDTIIDKIKAETEAELRERIRKEEHQKIMDGIAQKNRNPSGLREARQAGGDSPKTTGPKPLSAFFHN